MTLCCLLRRVIFPRRRSPSDSRGAAAGQTLRARRAIRTELMTSYTGCDALLHCTSYFGASFLSLPPSSRAAHRCTPWSTCQGCRWPCATAPAFTPLSWRTRAICSRACARASTRTGPISTCVHTRGRTTRAHAPASLRDMREGRHGCACADANPMRVCARGARRALRVHAARCIILASARASGRAA
jgi:hypothetical protein